MAQKIVIINGKGGSGKDTFVKFCEEACNEDGRIKIENISTVDSVKEIASSMLIDVETKTEKERKLLSGLNHLWNEYNWYPLKSTVNKTAYSMYAYKYLGIYGIIFIHCREPEYIDKLKEFFAENEDTKDVPVETLLIRNPNVPDITTNESDRNVENYKYDVIVDNDGSLNHLKVKAAIYMKSWLEDIDGKKQNVKS